MERWERRIEKARQRRLWGIVAWPHFTNDERRLARDWQTCAVGEARRRYGARIDPGLQRLGVAFYRAVFWNDVDGASVTWRVIEEYALEGKRRDWEARRAAAVRRHEEIGREEQVGR